MARIAIQIGELGETILYDTFDTATVLAAIERERIANLGAFPTQAIMLLDHPDRARRDLSSLRTVLLGGAPASPALIRRVQETLSVRVAVRYSSTEVGIATGSLPDDPIDVLATTQHKVIVSMGPRADEIQLADNMVGASIVPQTKVIPQVDLVITHGGNNTTTESMHFGKPMIVLPLFWDQYDNAQRVHETGFGRRLSTYGFTDEELLGAVEELLGDSELRERSARVGAAIRERDGLRRGAEIIERVGLEHVRNRS